MFDLIKFDANTITSIVVLALFITTTYFLLRRRRQTQVDLARQEIEQIRKRREQELPYVSKDAKLQWPSIRPVPSKWHILALMVDHDRKYWAVEDLVRQLRLTGFGSQFGSLDRIVRAHLRRLAARNCRHIRVVPQRRNPRQHEQVYCYTLAE